MKITKHINSLLFTMLLITGMATIVSAETEANIVVKTVLASQGKQFIDPQLSALIHELQSVFKYSSYRLLSQNQMKLKMTKTGTATLPESRIMKITPIRITGNRAELRLEILKNNHQTFQTVIQLLNNGSITVGGPKYQDGYLLFNIFISF